MEIYRRFHPNPILVYTDAFEVDSFITTTAYRRWVPWSIGEQVLFRGEEVKCRIIGRDDWACYRYSRYFLERHKSEGSMESDFNYPRNFIARRTSSWS